MSTRLMESSRWRSDKMGGPRFLGFMFKSWRIFPRLKSPRNSPQNHHQLTTFPPAKNHQKQPYFAKPHARTTAKEIPTPSPQPSRQSLRQTRHQDPPLRADQIIRNAMINNLFRLRVIDHKPRPPVTIPWLPTAPGLIRCRVPSGIGIVQLSAVFFVRNCGLISCQSCSFCEPRLQMGMPKERNRCRHLLQRRPRIPHAQNVLILIQR